MIAAAPSLDAQRASRTFRTLAGLAEELRAATVRILAYVCGLLLLALIATDVTSRLFDEADMAPRVGHREVAWSPVERPQPAFAAAGAFGSKADSKTDLNDRTTSYEIQRHAAGGRKDMMRWGEGGVALPTAVIEVYRPGEEWTAFAPPTLVVAEGAAPFRPTDLQAAGVVETKFGQAALVSFRASHHGETRACTGFVQAFDAPLLQLSGWVCEAATSGEVHRGKSASATQQQGWLAQRQSAICLLNRLTLLAAGSDPKLAEFFARAERKRGAGCGDAIALANADWMLTAERPRLRGTVTPR